MSVEAMHIIRIFQPLFKMKIADAYLFEGRWLIKYEGYRGIYQDLSSEVKYG